MEEQHMEFKKLKKLVDVRSELRHSGSYRDYGVSSKTDIAIHHSLTKEGSAFAFARYHVDTLGWEGIGYHFVILKDGTIQWCHNPGVLSYHVGASNKFALGICLVGDFRSENPTQAQKESLKALVDALKKDLPNYKRTRGHNEFPGYAWKACPVFDYQAVIKGNTGSGKPAADKNTGGQKVYVVKKGDTFWGISNDFKVDVDALQQANKDLDPKALPIGEKIVIPSKGSKAPAKPKPKPKPKKRYLVLPKTESSWKVYDLDVKPVSGNEKGNLNPKKFGGLEYEIIRNGDYPDVYIIKSSDFGTVQIYAPELYGEKIIRK
jgi:LysM repeat protein